MKSYIEIPGPSKAPRLPMIAFDKLDGSNLRFGWSRKNGWHKFGTRHRLFSETDKDFGSAVGIFQKIFAAGLDKILRVEYNCVEAIAFCEFFGPSSFAGWHKDGEEKILVLFDVNLHKRGFVPPREFLKQFGHLPIPSVIYEGNLTDQFIQDVREGKYPVVEGVVCKGTDVKKHHQWMCKIKTKSWLDKLKSDERFNSILKDNLREQQ